MSLRDQEEVVSEELRGSNENIQEDVEEEWAEEEEMEPSEPREPILNESETKFLKELAKVKYVKYSLEKGKTYEEGHNKVSPSHASAHGKYSKSFNLYLQNLAQMHKNSEDLIAPTKRQLR